MNAAGYVRVDDAESEPDRCWHENVIGAITVAQAAHDAGIPSAAFSSDLVFDGAADQPYTEADTTRPLNVYGRTKAAAEERILVEAPSALVIRTAAFFGPWDSYNFAIAALRAVSSGATFPAAADVRVSPTYVPDLADAVLDLLLDGEQGIWHVANPAVISWFDFARQAVAAAGLGHAAHLVRAIPIGALNLRAPRPTFSALRSSRGLLLGSIDDAIARFARDYPAAA